MDTALPVGIALVAVVTVFLGLVAAAETAIERASDVRIQAAANRGHPQARRIAGNVKQPAAFLGGLTTARVLASSSIVAIGAFLGAREYGPGGAISIGLCAGAYVTLVQLSVGMAAARAPEYAALQLSTVVRTVGMVFAGPAFILGLPSRLLAGSIRVVRRESDTDILSIIEREEASRGVEDSERRMIQGVLDLEGKAAREIMVPRIDIAAADVESTVDELTQLINERGVSRVPVFRENIDNIIGLVYAKDLLRVVSNGNRDRTIEELAREAFFIPESKRLDELLTEMRGRRTHIAIVVDEYGGTAGLVTIEDLLEEIIGEIEDEYDVAGPRTEILTEDEALLDGGVTTDVLKELFGFEVDSDDFDTVGGLLMHQLGRLPVVGDEVSLETIKLRVLSMAGRRVRRLRVSRLRAEEEALEAANR